MIDFKKWHIELGCEDCVHCDEDALYNGACCTVYNGVNTVDYHAACTTRKGKFMSDLDRVLGIEQ